MADRRARDIAGIVHGFEICYELAWHSLQDEAQAQGVVSIGPKPALRYGLSALLIPLDQEEGWVKMHEDRNLAAHTYRPEWAMDLVARIRDDHFLKLKMLADRLAPPSQG